MYLELLFFPSLPLPHPRRFRPLALSFARLSRSLEQATRYSKNSFSRNSAVYVTYVGKKKVVRKMNSDDDLVDFQSAEASQPLMKRKQTLKGKEYQTQLYQDQRKPNNANSCIL